ncbi:hypothetical protein DFH27DRAFT_611484 [Peziza echinospora]|nr:hypothetical protein DFH27DRAFT_611484 [Peziza echinospora]
MAILLCLLIDISVHATPIPTGGGVEVQSKYRKPTITSSAVSNSISAPLPTIQPTASHSTNDEQQISSAGDISVMSTDTAATSTATPTNFFTNSTSYTNIWEPTAFPEEPVFNPASVSCERQQEAKLNEVRGAIQRVADRRKERCAQTQGSYPGDWGCTKLGFFEQASSGLDGWASRECIVIGTRKKLWDKTMSREG